MKSSKAAIVLVNLGSPNELSTKSISKFLQKFLSDKRVISLPKALWYPILYGFILPFRSKRLLKQYSKIWLGGKSPLIYYSEKQSANLAANLNNPDVIIKHAFCYSNPQLDQVLCDLNKKHEVEKLIILPLYPQFSSTTTLSVFDIVARFYDSFNNLPDIHFIRGFASHPSYICAIAASIKDYWAKNSRSEKLLFSYHSLPQSIIDEGDPYYAECMATSTLIANELGLDKNEYEVAFQSKFGANKWLEPSTLNTVIALAKAKTRTLDVVCPGFICDCLETLEEIAILNKAAFLNNGGISYNYISCLNDSKLFTDIAYSLTKKYL